MKTASTFQLKGLREKRGELAAAIRKLGDKMHAEQRALTSDEKATFDKLKTDWTAVNDAVRTAEATLQEMDALVNSGESDDSGDMQENSAKQPGRENRDTRPTRRERREVAATREDRATAFKAWCRAQYRLGLKREHLEACERAGVNPKSKEFVFRLSGNAGLLKRALGVGTSALGGATVPQDFAYELEKALVDFSNVRGVVGQFTTDTGADMPYPTEDDTTTEGEQLGEGLEAAFNDDSFSSVTFRAFKYSSKGILISSELLNDSAFDLESHIGEILGMRLGRITGRRYTTGTGSGQPQGIVTAASAGLTSASATAFTADELTRLAFSVDRAYRSASTCGYMMHDSILAYALLLKDGQNRPLLRDSYRDGITIPQLNGFPVYTNQFMAAANPVGGVPVTATVSVLFGDFNKHKIRDVGSVRLRRLDERYAEKDQVGFIGFMRTDSRCINTAAIKKLTQA